MDADDARKLVNQGFTLSPSRVDRPSERSHGALGAGRHSTLTRAADGGPLRGLAALNALDARSLAIVVRITAVGGGTVWAASMLAKPHHPGVRACSIN
ncbi:MAG: hypothetical protein ACMG6S_33370 [Byssovorax sp.]